MAETPAKKHDWYLMDSWNYREALGDTVMEKYESLYVKLFELFRESTPYVAPDWIICGPDVASLFETSTSGFEAEFRPENVDVEFYKAGRGNKTFDIYVDKNLKAEVYVGCGKGIKRLTIKDFIV